MAGGGYAPAHVHKDDNDNIIISGQGTGKAYTLSRLKRRAAPASITAITLVIGGKWIEATKTQKEGDKAGD